MLSFVIQSLEMHLPAVENVIFSAKIPRRFAWEDGSEVKFLCFFINYIVEGPLVAAWTIPKFNGIVAILLKGIPEFTKNCWWMNLIRMQWWIENFLSSMDRIHDDYNSICVRKMGSLINIASYYKEFCFIGHDIHYTMNCLDY